MTVLRNFQSVVAGMAKRGGETFQSALTTFPVMAERARSVVMRMAQGWAALS